MKKDNGRTIGFLESFIYGISMGIFEVVPGISGGTLALILGIYKTIIGAMSNIRKDFKNSFKILFPPVLGMGVGVYCFSFIISFLNKNYPMEVNFLLIGLILGVIPSIFRRGYYFYNRSLNFGENIFSSTNKRKLNFKFTSCFLAFALTLIVMILINYLSFTGISSGKIVTNIYGFEIFKFMGVGAIASFCLMLPGCSGSLIMLVFGIYYSVIEAIHRFNFSILFTVGLGAFFGLIFGAKIIYLCFKHFKAETHFAILGLVVGSSISPLLNFIKSCSEVLNFNYILSHGIISIICLALGCFFSFSFSCPIKPE